MRNPESGSHNPDRVNPELMRTIYGQAIGERSAEGRAEKIRAAMKEYGWKLKDLSDEMQLLLLNSLDDLVEGKKAA